MVLNFNLLFYPPVKSVVLDASVLSSRLYLVTLINLNKLMRNNELSYVNVHVLLFVNIAMVLIHPSVFFFSFFSQLSVPSVGHGQRCLY